MLIHLTDDLRQKYQKLFQLCFDESSEINVIRHKLDMLYGILSEMRNKQLLPREIKDTPKYNTFLKNNFAYLLDNNILFKDEIQKLKDKLLKDINYIYDNEIMPLIDIFYQDNSETWYEKKHTLVRNIKKLFDSLDKDKFYSIKFLSVHDVRNIAIKYGLKTDLNKNIIEQMNLEFDDDALNCSVQHGSLADFNRNFNPVVIFAFDDQLDALMFKMKYN